MIPPARESRRAGGRISTMRRWIPAVLLPLALTFASASHALAPGDRARGFREGANHHLGDDGFAALFGRLPGPGDGEALRMHSHFTHAREWLASRAPTRPELAGRRAELLGYLDEYIAKGTTPANAHVPWRTPVFIDDAGTICAVGYLIERSAGRALAEKVATEHRYAVLEDIAAAIPAVRAWVEGSGFTLEELASVQPGYTPPVTWNAADLVESPVAGASVEPLDAETSKGTWKSTYPSGARLAEGPFVDKRPHGTWRFYHPSGNLAAQGRFERGARDGVWSFFHDTADGKEPVLMATGAFMGGTLIEEWRHYDHAGKLVARSRPESPWQWRGAGYLVATTPKPGLRHWVHRGNVAGTRHRLDYLTDGTEQVYAHDEEDVYYDAGGHKLARVGDTAGEWTSSDCKWSRLRRASASSGDLVTLDGLGFEGAETCDAPRAVPAARAVRLEAMRTALHEERGEGRGADAMTATLASLVAPPSLGDAPRAKPPSSAVAAR